MQTSTAAAVINQGLTIWTTLPVAEALIGFFGGAGAVLIWELILKPRRERRNVARVIAAEVLVNLQFMYGRRVRQRSAPTHVPASSSLSLVAFQSVGDRIGELPADEIRAVVELYAHFDMLNRLVRHHSASVEKRDAYPPDSDDWHRYHRRKSVTLDAFKAGMEATISDGERVLLALEGIGKRKGRLNQKKLTEVREATETEALEAQRLRAERLAE